MSYLYFLFLKIEYFAGTFRNGILTSCFGCGALSIAFTVEAPNFVDLEVTETEPGVKGDTATNVTKAATVETGAVIQVPIFINEGEKIQIDTRTGDYLGRSK